MTTTLSHISTMLICALMLVACSELSIPPYDELRNAQLLASTEGEQSPSGAEVKSVPFLETATLDPYLWNNRLLLIFAESAADNTYADQLRQYAGLSYELLDRDMIWLHIFKAGPDAPNATEISTDGTLDLLPSYADAGRKPIAQLPNELVDQLRSRYNPDGAAFRIVLIGKDGGVKYDTTEPLGPESLFSTIDAMPMRQQEMQQSDP